MWEVGGDVGGVVGVDGVDEDDALEAAVARRRRERGESRATRANGDVQIFVGERGAERMVSMVRPDGTREFYAGPPGDAYLTRTIYPDGRIVLRRGTMDEKRWRLKGRVERRAIAALVAQAQKEGGAPTTPPPRWATLRPGEAETQRAAIDARGGARTLEELSEDI